MSARACPVDGSILLTPGRHNAVFGICDHCHGLWVSERALQKCLRERKAPARPQARRTHLPPSGSFVRLCPDCPDAVLDPTVRSAVQVDVCPTCRGVWFDAGEIEQIIATVGSRTLQASGSRPLLQRANDSAEIVEIVGEVLFNFGPSAVELGAVAVKAVAEAIIEIISASS